MIMFHVEPFILSLGRDAGREDVQSGNIFTLLLFFL